MKKARRSLWASLLLAYALCVSSVHAAAGQDETDGAALDRIKALLLRPQGWLVEWSGPWGSGEAGLNYEARGPTTVVVIELLVPPFLICEREVTITPAEFSHDGCRDTNVILRFDPHDRDYPFKGKGFGGTQYRFRAK